jgi:anti-anti-sigma regulatory factor
VDELRACWQHLRHAAGDAHAVVVDLSDVTFIDENGETLLSEMGNAGVEFVAAGVETIHLLENLKGNGDRPLRRLIGR